MLPEWGQIPPEKRSEKAEPGRKEDRWGGQRGSSGLALVGFSAHAGKAPSPPVGRVLGGLSCTAQWAEPLPGTPPSALRPPIPTSLQMHLLAWLETWAQSPLLTPPARVIAAISKHLSSFFPGPKLRYHPRVWTLWSRLSSLPAPSHHWDLRPPMLLPHFLPPTTPHPGS